jgi:hypothetical protein
MQEIENMQTKNPVMGVLFLPTVEEFNGIDRPFELRGESGIIRSVMINWSSGGFSNSILKGHHHKKSIKLFYAA